MSASFLDSNVLLYIASGDVRKAGLAERLISAGGLISVQVLNECANVCIRKMRLSWTETHLFLDSMRGLLTVVPVTLETHERGIALAERYRLSTFDAMIVASALLAGCDTLWSEDMQDGLLVGDALRIKNPFA